MPATVRVAFTGSPDGNEVFQFEVGEEISPTDHRMSQSLWDVAVREGWIEPVQEKARPAPENKAVDAPETKTKTRKRKR